MLRISDGCCLAFLACYPRVANRIGTVSSVSSYTEPSCARLGPCCTSAATTNGGLGRVRQRC